MILRLKEIRAELRKKSVGSCCRHVCPIAIPRFLKIDCERGYGDVIDLLKLPV